MCFAPRYMNAPTAAPRFDCTNEASRFDTLCAAAGHGHSASASSATRIAPIIRGFVNNWVLVLPFSALRLVDTAVCNAKATWWRKIPVKCGLRHIKSSAQSANGTEEDREGSR